MSVKQCPASYVAGIAEKYLGQLTSNLYLQFLFFFLVFITSIITLGTLRKPEYICCQGIILNNLSPYKPKVHNHDLGNGVIMS